VILLQDLFYALRQLLRHRIYALTAIVSMALGIGATAAVYSVLYGVLIDPYPYRDANRLAVISIQTKHGQGEIPFTLSELDQLRQTKSVENTLAQDDESMVSTDGEIPQSVKVFEFSGSAFQVLDAPPLMGRVFNPSEVHEGVAPPAVAVISYLFWRSHFASDPNVLGKVLELNQHKYTVIGVEGPRFTWGDGEVYLPLPAGMDPKRRFHEMLRLRPGVSTAAATGELSGIVQQMRQAEPLLLPKDGYTIRVETLNDSLLGQFKRHIAGPVCGCGAAASHRLRECFYSHAGSRHGTTAGTGNAPCCRRITHPHRPATGDRGGDSGGDRRGARNGAGLWCDPLYRWPAAGILNPARGGDSA
jgi:hypothetical protein